MRRWFPVWVFPVVVLMAVATVWLRLTVVRTTYSVHDLDRRIRDLQREIDQTELKVAQLKSPRRLEQLAKSRFKLLAPRSDQVVHMSQVLKTGEP